MGETGDKMDERTDSLGRARRTYHTRADYRAVLGTRGTLGEGRNAVAYAWHDGCNAWHIAPARAYHSEPHAPRERTPKRWPMDTVGTSDVRTCDPWDGTRHVHGCADAVRATLTGARDARVFWYWRNRNARERAAQSPQRHAHTCPSVRSDAHTPRCTCAAFGGAPHTHRPDDGIAHTQAPRLTYAQVLERIAARERAHA